MGNYDICIIGAGPACFGILDGLRTRNFKGSIIVIEQGNKIEDRTPADKMHGFGGAGAFTDMKLMIDEFTGGDLGNYIHKEYTWKYISHAKDFYIKNGAPENQIVYGHSHEEEELAHKYGLTLQPTEELIHCGTDRAKEINKNIYKFFKELDINWCFHWYACGVYKDEKKWKVIIDDQRKDLMPYMSPIECKKLIIATGRSHNVDLSNLEIEYDNNIVDIGVRAEINELTGMKPWFDKFYHPKIKYVTPTYGDNVRTFCSNPQGFIAVEDYGDFKLVNGDAHKDKKTTRTNFAILVSIPFTDPFKDGNEFAKKIARTVCQLNDGKPIVQSYRDLKHGRRSTLNSIMPLDYACNIKDFCPGDLSIVIPYRYMKDIMEFVERLDKMFWGIAESMLLYGLEAKFYSNRPKFMNENFEVQPDLYFVGDCSGVTRGIIQATAMGYRVGRVIGRK